MRAETGRDRTDRGVALRLASWFAALAAASLLARAVGAPEIAAGGTLLVLVAAVLAGFVYRRLRAAGITRPPAAGWALALLCASVAPPLMSLFPGRLLADSVLTSPGEVTRLPPATGGSVRVLVSAPIPDGAYVSFSLRADGATLDGTLRRGIGWWGGGEEKRHYHEDRTSVLLDGVPQGARALVLTTLGGNPVALRVRAFAAPFPAWVAPVFALMMAAAFGLRRAERRLENAAVAAGCVGVCMGVATGSIVTPINVLRPVLAGLLTGAVAGIPFAVGTQAAGRTIRRLTTRPRAARRGRAPR